MAADAGLNNLMKVVKVVDKCTNGKLDSISCIRIRKPLGTLAYRTRSEFCHYRMALPL